MGNLLVPDIPNDSDVQVDGISDGGEIQLPDDTEIGTGSEGDQPIDDQDNKDSFQYRSHGGAKASLMGHGDELPVAKYSDEEFAV